MRRRRFLKTTSIAGLAAIAGCTDGDEVEGEIVVDERVRGGGDLVFEAESGDTIHFWAAVDGADEGVGVVMDPDGNRLIEEDIRTETEASTPTDNSGEHTLHIASGPTVSIDVESEIG